MSSEERNLLLDAFDSNWIAPLGPHVDAFEQEFSSHAGVPHAVALSSGTAALHLALRVLGIGPGDDVWVSTLTFAATANAVKYVGANPVFVDSDPVTWNMDPQLFADELRSCAKNGKLPKAVIVVDLYGQCADYDPILEACAEYEIPVIEDAAESLGATYKGRAAGSLGALGAFSFNGNKIITTSGGGMLVSQRSDWIRQARHLSTQARDPAPHYEHSQVGFNYRMSNLLAAVGRGQLMQLPSRVDSRRANNAFYREAFSDFEGIDLMPEATYGRATFWLSAATISTEMFGASRDEIISKLSSLDIESRPVWKPMHMQPVFKDCRKIGGHVSEYLFRNGLCLPSGSTLSPDDLNSIVRAVRSLKR